MADSHQAGMVSHAMTLVAMLLGAAVVWLFLFGAIWVAMLALDHLVHG